VLIGWDEARTELNFDPQAPYQVQVSVPNAALAAKIDTQNTFSALFLGLAGVALLVGGIGIANTMVISVLERRREIGLRRALGASRRHIWSQFITESIALSGIGGVAAAVAVGMVAGVYPAIRASRLTPAEALATP
jgi:putative ABC transport system permease protein